MKTVEEDDDEEPPKKKKSDKKLAAARSEAPILETSTEQTVAPRPPPPQQNESVPGAFHVAGPDAQDGSSLADPDSDTDSSLVEVSADLVNTEEDDRNFHERLQQELEREREERERNTAIAEVVTRDGKFSPRCRRLFIVGAVLAIVAIVLGTVLPRVLEPEPVSPLPDLIELLLPISPGGGAALQTPSTPQSDALNWLANNTKIDSYSDKMKIQRYALATLYYSSSGNGWQYNTGWLSDEDECGWYNEADGPACLNGTVLALNLNDNNLIGAAPAEIALLTSLGKCLHTTYSYLHAQIMKCMLVKETICLTIFIYLMYCNRRAKSWQQ